MSKAFTGPSQPPWEEGVSDPRGHQGSVQPTGAPPSSTNIAVGLDVGRLGPHKGPAEFTEGRLVSANSSLLLGPTADKTQLAFRARSPPGGDAGGKLSPGAPLGLLEYAVVRVAMTMTRFQFRQSPGKELN